GCGLDERRFGNRGPIVLCLRWTDARQETSAPSCLHLGRSALLCVETDALPGRGVPESSQDFQPAAGTDLGHAALADRLGRFLLAGSSTFCPALVSAATAC